MNSEFSISNISIDDNENEFTDSANSEIVANVIILI